MAFRSTITLGTQYTSRKVPDGDGRSSLSGIADADQNGISPAGALGVGDDTVQPGASNLPARSVQPTTTTNEE